MFRPFGHLRVHYENHNSTVAYRLCICVYDSDAAKVIIIVYLKMAERPKHVHV
jgi:hypothetical protein